MNTTLSTIPHNMLETQFFFKIMLNISIERNLI